MLLATSVSAQNLEDVYQQVLQSDPRLLIGTLGSGVYAAREDIAFAALLPSVSLSGNWTENKRLSEGSSKDSYSGERYTPSISQPVINMARYYDWKKSKDTSAVGEYQRQSEQSYVRLDTIYRYFTVLSAMDEMALVLEERISTEKKLEHATALYEMQRIKVTEIYTVRARLDMLMAEEIDAMQVLNTAKESLSELTNSPINDISPLIESAEYIQQVVNIDEWGSDSITINSKLLALQKSIDAAQNNVSQRSAEHYPVLALQLNKQKSNIGFESSLSPSTTTEVALLNLTIPIYSGGRIKAGTYEASQQLAIAQAEYDKEKRKVIKDTRDMFLGVNAMVRRVEAADKARKSAGKSYQAMNRSYELSIATVSEVLDSQRDYSEAKRNYQRAKYDYVLKKTELFHLSGKLNDGVFYKISKWLM